jgi:hypothetical protein
MSGRDTELEYLRELLKMLEESLAREHSPEKESQLKEHLWQTLSRLQALDAGASPQHR